MITLDYFYKQRTLRGFGLKNFNWFTTLFTLVKLYFRITPFSIFFYLMELIRPRVSSRIVKFKRRKFIYGTYGLYIIRSFKHACRFFYRGAATRFDLETPLRLFCEIIAIFSGKSKTLEQRQEAHLSAFQSV